MDLNFNIINFMILIVDRIFYKNIRQNNFN